MEVVDQSRTWFRFRLNPRLLSFLSERGIRSAERNGQRWKEDTILFAFKEFPLESYIGIYHGDHLPQWGAFSYSFSYIHPEIRVGRYCSISWNVRVMGPHHGYHLVSNTEILYRKETSFAPAFQEYGVDWKFRDNPQKPWPELGHDVWLGQDVLLARGIKVGHGAVVGAGSVVTKDVPPYAIFGGAPAKLLKYRFSEKLAAELLDLQWWDYPLPSLNHLSLDHPERFVGEMQDVIAKKSIKPLESLGRTWDVLSAASGGGEHEAAYGSDHSI